VTDLRFVGLPDGRVAERGGAVLVETIRQTILDVCPNVVVTFGPDGITGHDDHVHNSWAVTRAWVETGIGDLWYAAKTQTWLDEWRQVHDELGIWMTGEPEGTDPEDVILGLDLDGPELERKRAVLAEHRSQTVAAAAALGEDNYRRWIRQETFRRPSAADLVAVAPSDAHRALSGAVV
jgi:LmbE family N-acetylglucosaminyl deacetylase